MKKRLVFYMIALSLILSGCSTTAGGRGLATGVRPAIGPTVEKKTVESIEAKAGNDISIHLTDGNLAITPWDKNYAQATIVKRFTAPASRETLLTLLDADGAALKRESDVISLNVGQFFRQKPLFRFEADIEFKIPNGCNEINISAKNGIIDVSGLRITKRLNITLDSGSIRISRSSAKNLGASLLAGQLLVSGFDGDGYIRVGRGDTRISSVEGDLQLASVSGKTTIENSRGKINCNISAGSLDVRGSYLFQGSVLYATCGNIQADVTGLDKKGTYGFKASKGSITLSIPKNTGYRLKSGTGGGKTDSAIVGGGGPLLDVFTNDGDIRIAETNREK